MSLDMLKMSHLHSYFPPGTLSPSPFALAMDRLLYGPPTKNSQVSPPS